MVINYSQECSFVKAVQQTFDGSHPCDLCKYISKAKDADKKSDKQNSTPKADLICVVRRLALLPPFFPVAHPEPAACFISGSQRPPLPPPRTGLA